MNYVLNVIKAKENVQIVEVGGYLTSIDLKREDTQVEILYKIHLRENSYYRSVTKELESFFETTYPYINIDITECEEDIGRLYDVEVRLFDGNDYRTGSFTVSRISINYLKFAICDFIVNDFKCKCFVVETTNNSVIVNFSGYLDVIYLKNYMTSYDLKCAIEYFYKAAEKHRDCRYCDLLSLTEKRLRDDYSYITIELDDFNKYECDYLDYYLSVCYYKNGFKSTCIAINKCCLNYLYEFVKYLLSSVECKKHN